MDVLAKLVDRDKLDYGEDGIKGLAEQVEALKESKAYLFLPVALGKKTRLL